MSVVRQGMVSVAAQDNSSAPTGTAAETETETETEIETATTQQRNPSLESVIVMLNAVRLTQTLQMCGPRCQHTLCQGTGHTAVQRPHQTLLPGNAVSCLHAYHSTRVDDHLQKLQAMLGGTANEELDDEDM